MEDHLDVVGPLEDDKDEYDINVEDFFGDDSSLPWWSTPEDELRVYGEVGEYEDDYEEDDYEEDDYDDDCDTESGTADDKVEPIVRLKNAEPQPGPSQPKLPVDSHRREWESQAFRGAEVGLKIVDPNAKVYFVLDDHAECNTEDHNECILLRDGRNQLNQFDYAYDQAKYNYEQDLDIVDRLREIILNNPENQKEIDFDLSTIPSEHFHSMLRDRFGKLDHRAESYKTLFKNFATEVLKEYKLKIDEANSIIRECKFSEKDKLAEAVMNRMMPEKPLGFMTRDDPRQTQSANPYESGMNPYNVPREDPCQFIKRNIKKEIKTEMDGKSRELDVDYIALKNHEMNFSVIEPLLSNLKYGDYVNIHFPLASKILDIVLQYPLGITPRYLYQEFEKLHGYKIDYTGLGFVSFEQLLEKNKKVFTVLRGELLILTFPACQEKLLPVDAMQKNVYHKILIMMKMCGQVTPVPVEDVAKNLHNVFGIRFNVRAWGHESDALYYRVLLHKFDSGSLQVVQTNVTECTNASSKEAKFVLEFVKPREPTAFELWAEEHQMEILTRKEPEGTKKPSASVNHSKFVITEDCFVPMGTVIPSLGDYVIKGQNYLVKPELMVTPVHFFVSLDQNFDPRDDFFEYMTKTYNEWFKDSVVAAKFSVSAEHAQVNSYVVMISDEDWVRGRIVEIIDGFFKIAVVDGGYYERRVKLEQLKYLHKDFVGYPEQTFLCSFRSQMIEETYGDYETECFPQIVLRRFYDTLKRQTFYITPVNKLVEKNTWEVDLLIVDNPYSNDSNVVIHDLASSFQFLTLESPGEDGVNEFDESESEASTDVPSASNIS